MKISTLFIIFLFFTNLNAQEDNYWDSNKEKVQINKNLTAYTTYSSYVKNGVESKGKINNPSLKNPYNIIIRSNASSGKVVISNKRIIEDINLDFKYIYKIPTKDYIIYDFLMLNEKITVQYYASKKGSNDTLLVSFNKDSNNSSTVQYTISKI